MQKWQHIVASLVTAAALILPPVPVNASGVGEPIQVHVNVQDQVQSQKLSAADMDLLARVVSAEAQGEPYEGQVAVAAVILNRIDSNEFPDTVSGVVYEKHQFESVAIGSTAARPVASAVKAARDAVNGWDPVNGAVFFFNPAKTRNKFLWSRPLAKIIGNHRFTY